MSLFSSRFARAMISAMGLVALAAWAMHGAARGEDADQAGRLSFTTRRLVAFKDGYCLVAKDASGTADERGEVFTTEVPDAAVLGSFWATSAGSRLTAMIAGWDERERVETKQGACLQMLEILLANEGAQAAIEFHDRTQRSGRILQVLTQPVEAPLSPPQAEVWRLTSLLTDEPAHGLSLPQPTAAPTVAGVSGEFFVLRTEEGDSLIPISQVRSLLIPEMKTTLERKVVVKEHAKRLTFRFAEAAQRREFSLMYFRPGVRWIPTYRIQLAENAGKKTANVALQAEVLNEAEDFGDAALDIVVGVPNFRFRETPSPLTLEQTLRNVLQQTDAVLMGQSQNSMSNASYGQRSSEFRRQAANASGVAEGGTLALPDELTAQGAQDLFVYHLPPLRLKTGERAAAPIFTAEVPYRDIYTWDLRVKRQDIEAAPSGSGVASPLVLAKNEVWHQVALTNNTKLPWTTGAAMLMEEGIPLSQELLTYTSPKDEARVPVTVSVETRGSFEEQEIGRELESITWNGYRYAKIIKQAKLDLCNNKPVAIEAEITFHFGGKAVEATNDGAITLDSYNGDDWTNYTGEPAVNNSSTVRWRVKLGPGETFAPTVTYHYTSRGISQETSPANSLHKQVERKKGTLIITDRH